MKRGEIYYATLDPSKVQIQQIRTIFKQRISGSVIGSLKEPLMQLVDAAIKLHLAL